MINAEHIKNKFKSIIDFNTSKFQYYFLSKSLAVYAEQVYEYYLLKCFNHETVDNLLNLLKLKNSKVELNIKHINSFIFVAKLLNSAIRCNIIFYFKNSFFTTIKRKNPEMSEVGIIKTINSLITDDSLYREYFNTIVLDNPLAYKNNRTTYHTLFVLDKKLSSFIDKADNIKFELYSLNITEEKEKELKNITKAVFIDFLETVLDFKDWNNSFVHLDSDFVNFVTD